MPSGAGTGTKPLHNKQKKKAPKEEDDEEAAAYKAKKMADARAEKDMKTAVVGGRKMGKGLAYGDNSNKKK